MDVIVINFHAASIICSDQNFTQIVEMCYNA